ncbi:MAG: hypothetical protein WA672_05730 [Candidatus Angelobacter sp.]
MAVPLHILSFGRDPALMSSRTLLLVNAGYAVQEAYTLEKAVELVDSDSIDLTLICHTVPQRDQQIFISVVRKKRRLMPVLCIRSYAYESSPRACTPVDNDPEALLHCVKSLVPSPSAQMKNQRTSNP